MIAFSLGRNFDFLTFFFKSSSDHISQELNIWQINIIIFQKNYWIIKTSIWCNYVRYIIKSYYRLMICYSSSNVCHNPLFDHAKFDGWYTKYILSLIQMRSTYVIHDKVMLFDANFTLFCYNIVICCVYTQILSVLHIVSMIE